MAMLLGVVVVVAPGALTAVRLLPTDSITRSTWSYDGRAKVIDDEEHGWNSTIWLELEDGTETWFDGDDLPDAPAKGKSFHLSARCQAWHGLPWQDRYVPAWCDIPMEDPW